ncbi:PAAR-like domain-containing protein [Sorangium sp. So ce269]
MGKVTALHLDTITEKSGHQMTGMAVSVCLTPAAPSPLPIPYPTMGTVAEGIIDPCMRTKIEGAKILTVGGCMARRTEVRLRAENADLDPSPLRVSTALGAPGAR